MAQITLPGRRLTSVTIPSHDIFIMNRTRSDWLKSEASLTARARRSRSSFEELLELLARVVRELPDREIEPLAGGVVDLAQLALDVQALEVLRVADRELPVDQVLDRAVPHRADEDVAGTRPRTPRRSPRTAPGSRGPRRSSCRPGPRRRPAGRAARGPVPGRHTSWRPARTSSTARSRFTLLEELLHLLARLAEEDHAHRLLALVEGAEPAGERLDGRAQRAQELEHVL